jgi:hypothetical protein
MRDDLTGGDDIPILLAFDVMPDATLVDLDRGHGRQATTGWQVRPPVIIAD